jgi:predicted MPP superfamily phosphohydrolase
MDSHTANIVIRFSIFIVILGAIDFYVFHGIKTLTQNLSYGKYINWAYWIINCSTIFFVFYNFLTARENGINTTMVRYGIGLMILISVPKIIFSLFLLSDDLVRLLQFGFQSASSLFQSHGKEVFMPDRRKLLIQAGVLAAAIPFTAIIHGIWKGRYNFKIREITLKYKDLPIAFDGFTITQLSDIHIGSFDNQEAVAKGIAMANSAKSDVIVFTGDLVNNVATEVEPWLDILNKLSAPLGVHSTFGNHDYGDYVKWDSKETKQQNLENLKKHHASLGWNLLLNEHKVFEKNGEKIYLVGIENWGLPPFPQYCNLNKAITNEPNAAFKVLLSHDPSHWDAEAKKHESKIHLALAGHTHGMQFGIEIPGIKWSPVKFKYPKWADVYEEDGKYLYVNRGFGYLAFPGRVGIWPEITKITLRRA